MAVSEVMSFRFNLQPLLIPHSQVVLLISAKLAWPIGAFAVGPHVVKYEALGVHMITCSCILS